MILYFSGTGNSEYVARRIGREIDDETVSLFPKIRDRDFSEIRSESPWVVVAPTYAWRMPRIVHEWLKNTNLAGSRDIYFVLTCGGSAGNAGGYLQKLCAAKKLNNLGCMDIQMPENYTAMFSTPAREQALEIIRQSESAIERAASFIKRGEAFPQPEITLGDRLSSGVVNDVFYPMFVHADKFYATSACVSCGKCVRVCPLKNVRLEDGKPAWGKSCTHCMACINRCPSEAIEYGARSKGKARYICPIGDEEKAGE